MKPPYDTVISLLRTEKGTDLPPLNKYIFLVGMKTSNLQIKEATGQIYKVKVSKGNIARALKEYKSKVIKTRQMREVNSRKEFEKPSGKNRRITPLIHIEPTRIGGVTVRKMTGHNLDFFRNLGVYKGCDLLFERANDVIPAAIKVIK